MCRKTTKLHQISSNKQTNKQQTKEASIFISCSRTKWTRSSSYWSQIIKKTYKTPTKQQQTPLTPNKTTQTKQQQTPPKKPPKQTTNNNNKKSTGKNPQQQTTNKQKTKTKNLVEHGRGTIPDILSVSRGAYITGLRCPCNENEACRFSPLAAQRPIAMKSFDY